MFPLFRSQLYFFSAVGFFFDWVDSIQFVRTNSLNLEPSEEFQLETNSKADLNFFAKLRRGKNNYNGMKITRHVQIFFLISHATQFYGDLQKSVAASALAKKCKIPHCFDPHNYAEIRNQIRMTLQISALKSVQLYGLMLTL